MGSAKYGISDSGKKIRSVVKKLIPNNQVNFKNKYINKGKCE